MKRAVRLEFEKLMKEKGEKNLIGKGRKGNENKNKLMNNIKWGNKEILKRREKMNHLKQDNNLLIIEIKKLYCLYEEIKKEQKN